VQSEPHDSQCNEENDMSDWSTFEDDVRSNARPRGPRCSVGVMLESLPPSGRSAVEAVLANHSFAIPAVGNALSRYIQTGIPSPWSLANHRRGKCACQR
jgi:hypothetical protein